MTWMYSDGRWWAEAALGGTIVLALGSLAARSCRQPVHRARVVVLTVLGSLLAPWISGLPFAPRWSAGLPSIVAEPEPTPSRPAGPMMTRLSGPSGFEASGRPPRVANAPGRPVVPAPSVTPERREARPPSISWIRLGLFFYVASVAGLAAWWLVGQALLWQVARSARPARRAVREAFLAISGPDGGPVRLLESDRIALPFTFTWATPTILVPSDMCFAANSDELRYALAHEWSHVEGRDYRAWTLVGLAGLLLFYQPLFWWLRRQLRLCQDYLADDRAAALGSPEAYAAYLVRLARRRVAGLGLPALGIGDRRSNLHRRVVMLVQDREPWERRVRSAWAFAAASAAALLMVGASGLRLDASPQEKPATPAAAPPSKPAAEAKAPGARTWEGTIVDKETGQPIAGARVLVRVGTSRDAKTNGWRDYRAPVSETGADGRYRFTLSPEEVADRYLYITLEVDQPDHVRYFGGYSYAMILKNEGLGERPFFEKLELRPGNAVEGRVVTPEGEPASGIMVQSYSTPGSTDSLNGGSFGQTRTDATGHFRLPVHREGAAVVWILPEKFAPSTHPLKDNKRGNLGTFTLARGMRIRGRMLDARGMPVGKIYISAGRDPKDQPADDAMPRSVADMTHRATRVADDGTFTLGPLPAGTYRVIPDERGWDPATREGAKDPVRLPSPAVFTAETVVLETGQEPEPLEIRAVPHVVVEAQMVDSKGVKKAGHEIWFSGQIDGGFWSTNRACNPDGKYTILAPHGLENAQIGLMTNEHSTLAHRAAKDGPLSYTREIRLGTLDHDVKGIEIIRYTSPIVLIHPKAADGRPLKGLQVSVNTPTRDGSMSGSYNLKSGAHSDIILEEQGDGRFRTFQMPPDREFIVTARADGFEPATRKISLPEGKTEEVELILQPEAPRKEGDK